MTTDQGQKIKGQGHETYQQLERYNSLATEGRINLKLGENWGKTYDTLQVSGSKITRPEVVDIQHRPSRMQNSTENVLKSSKYRSLKVNRDGIKESHFGVNSLTGRSQIAVSAHAL